MSMEYKWPQCLLGSDRGSPATTYSRHRHKVQVRGGTGVSDVCLSHVPVRDGRPTSGLLSNNMATSSFNRNPTGKNQFDLRKCTCALNAWTSTACLARADNEILSNALKKYHREQLTNNKQISQRLAAEYGIKMRCG